MAKTGAERSSRYRERKAALRASGPVPEYTAPTEAITDQSDPPQIGTEADAPQPRVRKAGRPVGSRNKPRPAPSGAAPGEEQPGEAKAGASDRPRRRKGHNSGRTDGEVQTMAARVYGMHQLIAGLMQAPELAISEKDAIGLTKSAIEVADAFDIDAFFESKWVSVLAFAGTAGFVYGPRLYAFQRRMAMEAQMARERADAANTVDGQAHEVNPQAAPEGHYNQSDGPNGMAGHA